jgi:integral membrane protein (TIGR01906 family)
VNTIAGRAGSLVIGLATALVIVAVTLPFFLNPVWVAFEQGRAGALAWTGYNEADLRAATDSILADLIVGPPEFDAEVAGEPVLNERERGHMRDVRGVFLGFFAMAALLAAAALAIAARRRGADRARSWRAVRAGAAVLTGVLVLGGIISFVAFATLFEVFHRLFFAGGSYTFDPATERLVQLFPFTFWQETAILVGAVCIGVSVVVAVLAQRGATLTSPSASEPARPPGATSIDERQPSPAPTGPRP